MDWRFRGSISAHFSLLRFLVTNLASRLQLDRAIVFSIAGYMVSALAMPVSSWLILSYFTANEQGYYYTFLSVLGLQIFFEMGVSSCVTQFASHEFAHLKVSQAGEIEGPGTHKQRFATIVRFTIRFYAVICLLAFVGIGLSGFLFFSTNPHGSVSWVAAWWWLCAANSLSLMLTAFAALLEGCNYVAWVAQARISANLFRVIVLCVSIIAGYKLFAPALASAASFVVLALFINFRWRKFFSNTAKIESPPNGLSWRQEIWPYQWRIGLSWMSGYFIFSLFNPVIFHYYGAGAAGQFGFTWALLGTVATVANAWSVTKVPRYGSLISLGQHAELDSLWRKSTAISFVIHLLGLFGFFMMVVFLQQMFPQYGNRMLGPRLLIWLMLAALLNNFVGAFAYYLRAHKKEPYLKLSIFTGIGVGASTLMLAKYISVEAVAIGYFSVTALMFPYALHVFRRCRADWKTSASEKLV